MAKHVYYHAITDEGSESPLYVAASSMRAWPIWTSQIDHAAKFQTRTAAKSWLRYAVQIKPQARIVRVYEAQG